MELFLRRLMQARSFLTRSKLSYSTPACACTRRHIHILWRWENVVARGSEYFLLRITLADYCFAHESPARNRPELVASVSNCVVNMASVYSS